MQLTPRIRIPEPPSSPLTRPRVTVTPERQPPLLSVTSAPVNLLAPSMTTSSQLPLALRTWIGCRIVIFAGGT